jgi:hypothetical protein
MIRGGCGIGPVERQVAVGLLSSCRVKMIDARDLQIWAQVRIYRAYKAASTIGLSSGAHPVDRRVLYAKHTIVTSSLARRCRGYPRPVASSCGTDLSIGKIISDAS